MPIAPPRRNRRVGSRLHDAPHHHLQINPPPARCAIVRDRLRPLGADRIPHFVKILDVANLRHPLPIRRIVRPPIAERIDVEIVAVMSDPALVHLPQNHVGHFLTGCIIR